MTSLALTKLIAGSGGGGGGKGGGSGGATPTEAPNSLRSSQKATVIDALCEGPIAGLVNGAQSVYFDKTPLQNADGSYNFNNAIFGYTTGDLASNYSGMSQMASDGGAVEATTPVGVRVWQATPIVRNVTTPNIDALRVTLSVPSLTYQDPSNGNVTGSSVEYTIDIQSNEGGFVTAVRDTISGKTTSRYSRSYFLPLKGSGPFDVRVTRITGDSGDTYLQNELWFDDFTSVISTKLEYRHTALAGIAIDAQQFSAIPTRAFDVKGLVINVPSNYDPDTRDYTGNWDGTFKLAWTDNPAWCFYDLLTNARYGLGDKIDAAQINKWQLYVIGQYCDALVPDGFGGEEPRFTCNLYLQTEEDAYKVIQNLASIFRAIVYWSAGSIAVMQDAPSDPVQMFAPANVVNGAFRYQGTSLKSRHSVALVSWNDPNDWYSQKIEYVQDDVAVAKYGVIKAQVTAFGCTSRGQAHRVGKWLLYSEQLETETVTFRCGMDGAYVYPGAIIQTSDPNRAGKRMAGRIAAVSADLNYVTLDAAPAITAGAGSTIEIIEPNGAIVNRGISAINANVVTLASKLPAAPLPNAIFMITEADLQPELWRVVTISEVETNQLEIGAIAHNPSKYASIEEGLALAPPQISNLTATPSTPTNLSAIISRYVIDIGVAGLRLTLSWSGSANRFNVTYRKENGQVVSLVQNQNSIDIENIDIGASYSFEVTAISTLGFASKAASLEVSISAPPMTYPDDVTGFEASVTSTGVLLSWTDIASPMLYDYEIREGTDWDSARSLGFFAGTQASVPPLPSSDYRWMIKARDKLLNESVHPDAASLGVSAPTQPTITAGVSGQNYVLSWNTPASMFPIDHYLIASGPSAATAQQIALAYTTQYQSKIDFVGAKSFWIAAVDAAGNAGPYGLAQITIMAPAQPVITTQVIDNNVLLYWSDATRSLPIATYQLRKGATFDNAEVIGTKSGLFTTVFETLAGAFTYWIVGIDTAGNIGAPGSITASVNAPPDYVLHSDQFSTFGGTLSNARLDQGRVVMPIETASTWAQHFTQNAWASPADQIAAGFPIYAEPTVHAGYYEEVIDYGGTLAATNVTVTPTITVMAGAPTHSITISASNIGPSGPWTDYADTLQVYLTNFRWLKIRLSVTSPDNKSLLTLSSLQTKLDVKLKSDAGMVLANAADSTGTPVRFNVPFSDVASITLTPQGSTPLTAIYDFSGAANPTEFHVMLFTPSGQRTSGTISWAAKGY